MWIVGESLFSQNHAAAQEEVKQNVKTLLQCQAKCQGELRCPKPVSRSCERCMLRECGSANDPKAWFVCEQRALATGKCSVCRVKLPAGRTFDQGKCVECMTSCLPGGGGAGNREQRTYPEFPVMPGVVLHCLAQKCASKCEASTRRVSKDGFEQLPSVCKGCILLQCPKKKDVPTFDDRKCRFDAYSTCSAAYVCPVLTEEQKAASKECRSCRQTCFPEADRMIIRRAYRAFLTCQANCKKRHSCPDPPDEECFECMEKECRNGPGGEMDSDCQVKAMYSAKCPSCRKTLPRPGSFNPRECAACMASCHPPDDSGPGIYYMGWHAQEQQYLPVASGECLRAQCTPKCPLEIERMVHVQSMPQSCLKCLNTICSFSDSRPTFDIEACANKAYAACGRAGFGCRVYEKEYGTRLQTCDTCVDSCISDAVKKEVRKRMAKAAKCRANCDVIHDDCPPEKEAPCLKCLKKHCENSPDRACVAKARSDDQKCPDCNLQNSKCLECIRNCD